MADQKRGFLDPGHPPIYSKKRKTTTRKKKGPKREGGAQALEALFDPPFPIHGSTNKSTAATDEVAAAVGQPQSDGGDGSGQPQSGSGETGTAGTSSFAAVSPPHTPAANRTRSNNTEVPHASEEEEGEETHASDDGGEGNHASDDEGQKRHISDDGGEESHDSDDEGAEDLGDDGPEHEQGPAEYSNEARVYHARYAELSQAHDQGRHDYCREGSLDMLTEPHLPRYTRVQILQMVSTLLEPAGAKKCLEEAHSILMDGDPDSKATQLLLEDNYKMWRDLYKQFGNALDSDGEDDDGADQGEASAGDSQEEIEPTSQEAITGHATGKKTAADGQGQALESGGDGEGVQDDDEVMLDRETQEDMEPFGRELPIRDPVDEAAAERRRRGLLSPKETDEDELERML